MAHLSTMSAGEVQKADRLDADYYKPADIRTLRLVRNLGGRELGDICSILNGRTPAEYTQEGVLSVVRSGDLVRPLIYPECGREFLHTSVGRETVPLKTGDVLISSIGLGSIGKISLVIEPRGFSTVSEVTILRGTTYPPEYLWAYLSTREGQSQIEREVTGATGQQHLLKSKVRRILVPPPPKGIEDELNRAILGAVKGEKAADTAYSLAESALVSALALDNLDLTPLLFNERSYKDVAAIGRFDAEYYQPAKWNILAALAKMNGRTVGEHCRSIRSLWQPDKAPPNESVRNFDLNDALSPFLDESLEPTPASEIGSIKKRLQAGDIVVSRLRSYLKEIAVVLPTDNIPMVGSSEFIVLRPGKDAIKAEALLVYLRSPFVQTVLKWCQDGSNHPRFDEKEVLGLRVPKVIEDIQDVLAGFVVKDIAARREARRLLDEAKALVEKAVLSADGRESRQPP